METVKKFLESSSIGGLSYISTSKSKAEKLFWLVVVLTSISVTSYLTTEAIVNWSKHPVATTTESFPISEVQFPKITVCPPKAEHLASLLGILTASEVISSLTVSLCIFVCVL